MMNDTPAAKINIDAELVRHLLAEQFPQWADLPILPAEPQGWDNCHCPFLFRWRWASPPQVFRGAGLFTAGYKVKRPTLTGLKT
jgi:hypothetical protein